MRNAAIVLLAALATASTAQAQFLPGGNPNYNPYGGPALSPYLNLLRNSNVPGSTAANLYLGTFPERYNRANISGLQRAVTNLDMGMGYGGDLIGTPRTSPGAEDLLAGDKQLNATGHPVYFNNTAGYFGSGTGTGLRSPLVNARNNIVRQGTTPGGQQPPRR